MLCPKCGSLKAHRSRRTGARDAMASLLSRIPYRCGACDARFYTRKTGAEADAVLRVEPSVADAVLRVEPSVADAAGISKPVGVAEDASPLTPASSKKAPKA